MSDVSAKIEQACAQPWPTDESAMFPALRSDFIDEFVRLEIALGSCLKRLEIKTDPRKIGFGQRLERLSKAKASSKLSGTKAADLPGLCEDCGQLQRLRSSIVHGVMELGRRDSRPVALFRNAADTEELVYHVLSAAEFRDAICDLKTMTNRVRNCLNQPFSPPRPKPA